MVCAFIVMKCEGFSQITDLVDYLDNNRLIAHYCGFNIMEPLPSYWTYDRFLRQLDNGALKEIMAAQLTTPGNIADSSVAAEILASADQTISLKECAFLADKGYDAKSIYNTVKAVYDGEAFIPLNPRGTKDSRALSAGNPVCEAGLATCTAWRSPMN